MMLRPTDQRGPFACAAGPARLSTVTAIRAILRTCFIALPLLRNGTDLPWPRSAPPSTGRAGLCRESRRRKDEHQPPKRPRRYRWQALPPARAVRAVGITVHWQSAVGMP